MGLVKPVAFTDYFRSPMQIIPGTGNKSLFLDATEELAHNTGLSCLHFKNKWTVAIWFTKEQEAGGNIIDCSDGASIRLRVQPISATDFRIIIRTVGSTVDKNLRINPFPAASNVWRHLVITLDKGASTEVKLYLEGTLITPTIVTDNALPDASHVDIDSVTVGANGAPDQKHYMLSIWDKTLAQNEITAIYNNGDARVDLLRSHGKYKSHKRLQHWFIYEADPGAMGKDWGRAKSEGMNLMTNNTAITAADDLLVGAPL